jgi:hypothetical protein
MAGQSLLLLPPPSPLLLPPPLLLRHCSTPARHRSTWHLAAQGAGGGHADACVPPLGAVDLEKAGEAGVDAIRVCLLRYKCCNKAVHRSSCS